MPWVIATPVTPPGGGGGGGGTTCADQKVWTAPITELYGCQLPARTRAVKVVQGQVGEINWQFTDSKGRPIDLSTCGSFLQPPTMDDQSYVHLRIVESALGEWKREIIYETNGVVTSPETGQVYFPITAEATKRPGVFLAETAVFDANGEIAFANQFFFIVNRGLHVLENMRGAPPTIAEIRLRLRDSDAAENTLLEEVQFDDAEMAAAIEYPVMYWNESQPPIPLLYDTMTFPYRFHWLTGICSQLYITAAHRYRRNSATAQGGGVTFDDQNKSKEYEAVGQQMWAEYKDFILRKKVGINALNAMQARIYVLE